MNWQKQFCNFLHTVNTTLAFKFFFSILFCFYLCILSKNMILSFHRYEKLYKQNYKAILLHCGATGEPFKDPFFPPEDKSLYRHNPPEVNGVIVWKRVKVIRIEFFGLFLFWSNIDDFERIYAKNLIYL